MDMLPVELQIHIFSYLPQLEKERNRRRENKRKTDIYPQTLFNLCLSSRNLYSVARPILYQTFAVIRTEGSGRRLRAFLRTIIEQPDLAAQLQYIRFRVSLQEIARGDKEALEADLSLFQQKASTIPGFTITRVLDIGNAHTQFMLLLCCAPNLEELLLQKPHFDSYCSELLFLASALSKASSVSAGQTPFLSKLKEVTLDTKSRVYPWLRVTGAGRLISREHREPYDPVIAAAASQRWSIGPKIEKLRLHGSYIPTQLTCALEVCSPLKVLEYSGAKDCFPVLDLRRIGVALSLSTQMLQKLRFDASLGTYPSQGVLEFSHFPQLKEICVSMQILVEITPESVGPYTNGLENLLPVSVESLELVWRPKWFGPGEFECLLKFASACSTRLPQLRTFKIRAADRSTILGEDEQFALEAAFEQSHVTLVTGLPL